MDQLQALYSQHPIWIWLAVAGILLAIEVATGSGYLLWAAAAAGVTGLLTLTGLPLGLGGEVVVFSVLTIVSSLLSRRWFNRPVPAHEDINDQSWRLVGRAGAAAGDIKHGRGRVFVDGAEWAAELDEAEALTAGAPVKVTGVVDGARLKVRPGT